MKIGSKIKWLASILLVFVIVLFTNLIDQDNFNQLSNSVTTMYEDRVVASDLLFEMSGIIHKKELFLRCSDSSTAFENLRTTDQELTLLLERYGATKLTEQEEHYFKLLNVDLESLKKKEAQSSSNNLEEVLSSIQKIKEHLNELSKVQLKEGKRQLFISNKAKDTINFFTQGEIIFLIIAAILVQIIILYKEKD